MGLASIVRKQIGNADKLTKDLQSQVTHRMWLAASQSASGTQAYRDVKRYAVVDLTQRLVRSSTGETVMSSGVVTFVAPVVVTPNDLIILPNGVTAPIVSVAGYIDPSTRRGFVSDVYLG